MNTSFLKYIEHNAFLYKNSMFCHCLIVVVFICFFISILCMYSFCTIIYIYIVPLLLHMALL